MSYLGIFGLQFQKTMVIFEISTLGFVKNEFLTHRLSFCIGSVYSKNAVSVFLKVRILLQLSFIKYALLDTRDLVLLVVSLD